MLRYCSKSQNISTVRTMLTVNNTIQFTNFSLDTALLQQLSQMGFTTPTPIQSKVIPIALEEKDIIGCAPTGTGKTIAFGVPLIQKLLKNSASYALVMVPTRELATQVMQQLGKLLHPKQKNIHSALLIGGDSMLKQLRQLDRQPRLIVGTPGRINDHVQRGKLCLKNIDYLVLDETDRMLDMGFTIQIDRIIKTMEKSRQTLLFSATLPENIHNLCKKYQHEPESIRIEKKTSLPKNLNHQTLHIEEKEKYNNLIEQLTSREGTVIIFVKTKYSAEKTAKKISQTHPNTAALHGDLRQNRRTRILEQFRKQKYRILVASDVAARCLDVPHIEHVINYDLPQCAEDFVHRLGRTARAGASGSALSYICKSEQRKWLAIDQLLHPEKHPTKGKSQYSSGQKRRKKPNNKYKFTSPKGSGNSKKPHSKHPTNKVFKKAKPSSQAKRVPAAIS